MIGWIILGVFILLIVVLLIRASMMKPAATYEGPAWQPPEEMDPVCEHLARAIRCRTVSNMGAYVNGSGPVIPTGGVSLSNRERIESITVSRGMRVCARPRMVA